jgi:hypothetical protein
MQAQVAACNAPWTTFHTPEGCSSDRRRRQSCAHDDRLCACDELKAVFQIISIGQKDVAFRFGGK